MINDVEVNKDERNILLPQDVEFVIEVNEGKRITVAKKKPVYQKRKGFGSYHCRKMQKYMPMKNGDRQLKEWRYKLEHLDTQKPMV